MQVTVGGVKMLDILRNLNLLEDERGDDAAV